MAYMITLTTYGTWLQGDEKGYVKDGKTYGENTALMQTNKKLQDQEAVELSTGDEEMVRTAIIKEAAQHSQQVYALSVDHDHMHIVVRNTTIPLSKMVAYYKNAARLALKSTGHKGKLWTKGYDKRFCFDEATLAQRINYVNAHNKRNI